MPSNIKKRLLQVMEKPVPEDPDYTIHKGSLHYKKETNKGVELVNLCNFRARIVEEIIEDDDSSTHRYLVIEGELNIGTKLPRVKLSIDEFVKMNWVNKHWGVKVIIEPIAKSKEHIATAIRHLSEINPSKTVYSAIGWRKINGEWVYVSSDKVIGKKVETAIPSATSKDPVLENYRLLMPSEGDSLREHIKDSLSFADIAPDEVTIPLLASVYRAPLSEADEIDLSLFVAGITGSQKSELAAIAQAHFGKDFDRKHLPGNWSSTLNALLKQAFLVKDAIFVIDDYVPGAGSGSRKEIQGKADAVFRAQGNKAGRARLRDKQAYYPRGLPVATGEDIPGGHSLQSRLLVIELSKGMVDLTKLTEIQRKAKEGSLCRAMSGYIRWLAPQMDKLKKNLPGRIREKRQQLVDSGHKFSHDRDPDIAASLIVGGEEILRFARESGALTDEEFQDQSRRFEAAILKAVEQQSSSQEYEGDSSKFVDLLRTALETQRVHLVDAKTEAKPKNPEKYGWRREKGRWVRSGKRIGWISGEDIYLDPDAAYSELNKLATIQGRSFQAKQRTLQKRLAEADILKSKDEKQKKNTVRVSIGGRRLRALHVDAGILDESDQSGQSGQSGQEDQ